MGNPGPRLTDKDRDLAIQVTAHVLEYMDETGRSQNSIESGAGFKRGRLSRFMTGARVEVGLSFLVSLADEVESSPTRLLAAPPQNPRFLEAARRRASASPRGDAPPAPVQAERRTQRGTAGRKR
jgi:hypothetical protein